MRKSSITLNLVGFGLLLALAASLGGCGSKALDPSSGYGPDPVLPTPNPPLIPVVKAPNAIGWSAGEKPVAAEGMEVIAFASGLDHPRWVYVLPKGDVLVAETSAPADRPEDSKGIKGWFFNFFKKKAGGGGRNIEITEIFFQTTYNQHREDARLTSIT